MESHSNTFNNLAAVNMETGRLVSVRMRGVENTSNANSRWNVIEDKEDENDVMMGGIPRSRNPISTASSIQTNSMTKSNAVTMVKKGNHSFHSKRSVSTSNCSGLRQNSCNLQRRSIHNPKYSYKLRNMLQTDLKMGGDHSSSTASYTASQSSSTTRSEKLTTSMSTSTTSSHRRKIRKTNSLQEVFSKDIQSLLNTLQSNEFVGTIHPQYHASYVSDDALM